MDIFRNILLVFTSLVLALRPLPAYTEGVVGQPRSFFPNEAKAGNDKTISTLIYRGLFKYDIYGSLMPDLAQTWEISEDGLVYTIKLKENQYWSSGKKISADDLIYTSFNVEDLLGVATDKVDSLTVRYTLPNKYSPFLSLLTVGVMPSDALKNQNGLNPVTSGDFRVVQVEKSGGLVRKVVLASPNEKNDIRKIIFKYYSNEAELKTAAKLGEIDAFMATDTFALENFDDHTFAVQGIYYALYFNLRREDLKDLTLRQKMEKTLPISSLIYDRGIQVQGPISRSVFTDEKLVFNKYEEGFREQLPELTLNLTVPDVPSQVEMANKVKHIWEDRLGLNIDLIKVAPEEMTEKVIKDRDFDILLYGQEVGRDPDRYVNWHSTQKDPPGLNLSGYEQVRGDRALEEGRNETDNEKRLVHYNEFQKAFVDNTPAIFLYHPFTHYYVSKYIEGIGEKYTFTYGDRFLDFYNWKRLRTN
jgi:peptide/nickel transport system substrate-binding protein